MSVVLQQKASPIEDLRQMAYQEIDKFVDNLAPYLEAGKPMTLQQISALFQQEKPQLLGGLLQHFVEHNHRDSLDSLTADCPLCGKKAQWKRNAPRKITTLQGDSTLNRPYFYCHDCHYGFAPLDHELELANEKKQYDLQRKALRLLAEMPFETAAELFPEMTGVSFSDHSLHGLFAKFTDRMTLSDIVPSQTEIEERIRGAAEGISRKPIVVVASDGAHMPTRAVNEKKWQKGQYREAKGFRIYALGADQTIHQLVSWHQIQDADDFVRDLKQVAALIPVDKVRIALIGDGAGWLWRAMTKAFPGGREVLDYYHCSEHIHALAQSRYADNPFKALQWAESTMSRLFHHEVKQVIGGLKRMQTERQDVKEQIRRLIGYLQNNSNRIHYAGDRRGGYPIGSGGIESANKFICHTRMKRSGAWWIKENGNGMLLLRCAIANGTFDAAFSGYVTQAQAKKLRLSTNS